MEKFQKALAESAKPVLVEFYSPRCSHCVAMGPVIDELRAKVGSRAEIFQIDGTLNQDLMRQYKVASYPTYILFKDGQEVWSDSGSKPLSELEKEVRALC